MRPILLVALPLMLAQVTGCDQPPPPAPPTADTVTATARPETPPQSDTGEASRQALFGDLHVHSSWSDGSATIDEMAREARAMGMHYLG